MQNTAQVEDKDLFMYNFDLKGSTIGRMVPFSTKPAIKVHHELSSSKGSFVRFNTAYKQNILDDITAKKSTEEMQDK